MQGASVTVSDALRKNVMQCNCKFDRQGVLRENQRALQCKYHHQSTLRAKKCAMQFASVTIRLHCKNLSTMSVASVTVTARRAKKNRRMQFASVTTGAMQIATVIVSARCATVCAERIASVTGGLAA